MIKFDFNNMMDAYIGSEGITEKEIAAVQAKTEDAYSYFEKNRGTGWMGWSELPYNQEDVVRDIIVTAAEGQKFRRTRHRRQCARSYGGV